MPGGVEEAAVTRPSRAKAGMRAPSPRRQEALDLGPGPAVMVEGAPQFSLTGVVPGAQVVMGLAPATGRPKIPAESPERHVAIVMAAAAAVALPGTRTTTRTERAETTTSGFSRNVVPQGISQRVRLMPHAILEGKRKEKRSPSRSCQLRRRTTNLGSRPSRTG